MATTQDPQMVVPAGVLADRHCPSGRLAGLPVSPAPVSLAAAVLTRADTKTPCIGGAFPFAANRSDHALAAQVIVIAAAEIGHARGRELDDARGQRADEFAVMADEDQGARIVLQRQ